MGLVIECLFVMPVHTCIQREPLPRVPQASFLPITLQSAWDRYVAAEVSEMSRESQSIAG